MNWWPNSRETRNSSAKTPASIPSQVVTDVSIRSSELESRRNNSPDRTATREATWKIYPDVSYVPDRTATREATMNFFPGRSGQKIADRRNRTRVGEYKPQNPLQDSFPPLQDPFPSAFCPMPKKSVARKESEIIPTKFHNMYARYHKPTPGLPSIEKKKVSTGPKGLSTVNFPQDHLSDGDKSQNKDQNSDFPAGHSKKIGDNKLSFDKVDGRVRKSLTEVSEAGVCKNNLSALGFITALRQKEKRAAPKERERIPSELHRTCAQIYNITPYFPIVEKKVSTILKDSSLVKDGNESQKKKWLPKLGQNSKLPAGKFALNRSEGRVMNTFTLEPLTWASEDSLCKKNRLALDAHPALLQEKSFDTKYKFSDEMKPLQRARLPRFQESVMPSDAKRTKAKGKQKNRRTD